MIGYVDIMKSSFSDLTHAVMKGQGGRQDRVTDSAW